MLRIAIPATAATFLSLAAVSAHAQSNVTSNAFNPALSLILDGQYNHYSQDPKEYGISGFLLGDEAGLEPAGFSLGETELAASANIDDKFYGQVTLAIASSEAETQIEVEEAYAQTTALPYGLTARAGRFFSEIGYLNSRHSHTWDFADQPLAYRALLGNQFGDTGVQVKWLAPTTLFTELGVEAFQGEHFPAGGAAKSGVGAWTAFAHVGADIGNTQSWRAGISYLNTDSEQRESELVSGDTVAFTGSSDVWIADFVWKWADHGNPKSRNFVLQAEYLERKESGVLDAFASSAIYDGTQDGWYVQGAWQFKPRWRVGARYDQLSADNTVGVLPFETPLTDDARDPSRITAMLDFSNSEFSRFRLQVAQDKSLDRNDTQVTLQYTFSMGAHGAHTF
ncbi:MAG: hypothetical protein ACJ8OJ_03590 [Povalibacter sp.]